MIAIDIISRGENHFTYFIFINDKIEIKTFIGEAGLFIKMINKLHHQIICEMLCDFVKIEKSIPHSGKELITYKEAIDKVKSFIKYLFDNLGSEKNISYAGKIYKNYLNLILNFVEEGDDKNKLILVMYFLDKSINQKLSVYED